MQLDFNLKIENMELGRKTLELVTHGSKLANLPYCIKDIHALMLIVKKLNLN
jgi:hypothetical protein